MGRSKRFPPAILRLGWPELSADSARSRLVLVAASLAALLVLLLAIEAHLSPPATTDLSGTEIEPRPSTKLFVLVIDALTPEVVDSGHLTFLDPFLERGFRAEVEPCVDRLTIPCLRDAFTGVSSFGLFGAFSNLVSARQVATSNLFRDLRENGRTSAEASYGELGQFSRWIDVSYNGRDEVEAVAAMLQDGHDLVVYHHLWVDLVSHRAAIGSPPYIEALRRLDAVVGYLLASMPPEYELVVMGDHGHDEIGRHIQGLDVPTVFLSSGRLFGERALPDRIPITTYRYLLGAKLGILPPPQYEGQDLAAFLPKGSDLRRAAAGRAHAPSRLRPGFPLWPLIAALLLPALALCLAPGGTRGRVIGIAAAGCAFASGALYPLLVRTIHYNPALPDFPRYLPHLVVVAGIVGIAWKRRAAPAAWLLGLIWVAIPPTLYRYGLFQRAVGLAVVAAALFLLPEAIAAWRRTKSRIPALIAVFSALALLGIYKLIAPVHVMNFIVKGFTALDSLPAAAGAASWLTWGALATIVALGARRRVANGLLAAAGASGVVAVPVWGAMALTLLTGAAFWLTAPEVVFVAGAWMAPRWYPPAAALGVALCVLFVAAAAGLSQSRSETRRWTMAGIVAALTYYSLAFTAGLRANGIDYGFAMEWLPGRWAETLWFVIAAALAVKVLLPAGLIAHTTNRLAPGLAVRPALELVIMARLAALSLFVAGFLCAVDELPRYRLLEVTEDMIVWWLLLAFFAFVPPRTAAS